MKQINTGKAELLMVKLPDDTTKMTHIIKLNYEHNGTPHLVFDYGSSFEDIELPPYKWKVLGNPFDFTEEQWKEIVAPIPVEIPPGPGNDFCGDCYYGYIDYEVPGEYAGWGGEAGYCSTAIESGLSLLRANKIYQENPYKDPCTHNRSCFDSCQGSCWNSLDYTVEEFEEAEALTGNWICLIKVKDL